MADPRVQQAIMEQALAQGLAVAERELDEEIERLDKVKDMDDDDLEKLRMKRLEKMKTMHEKKKKWAANGHGSYSEISDQREFFNEMKKSERVVVHFYRPTTRRCEILDKHLSTLARSHMETRFVKINAEKSPFVCERLQIYMLPTMVLVKNGRTDHSIVGFDEMGGGDDFPTSVLEAVLTAHGILDEE